MNTRSGVAVASTSGPGIGAINAPDMPATLERLTDAWRHYDCRELFLSGMAGSSIGWVDTGYLNCPVNLDELCQHLYPTQLGDFNAMIVPGVRCVNPVGAPDVMRGEETQLLGALLLQPDLRKGTHLLCLPGTHNKWAHLQDGTVKNFITCPSGELFSLLTQNSVIAKTSSQQRFGIKAFLKGVERANALGPSGERIDLSMLLFETRSRQLDNSMQAEHCHAFLSGLVIGKDISSATHIYAPINRSASLIFCGDAKLADLYSTAARHLGLQAIVLPGEILATNGIHQLYKATKGN